MPTSSAPRRTVICVVGARPNYMKVAPIVAALGRSGRFGIKLVHTGQHYDREMNDAFFEDLGIPRPDVNLEVGSGTHAVQTAEVMKRFEPLLDSTPDPITLVVGDVNSTLACALVAAKKLLPVVHVEAGLRSFDRTMPEEVNRILTDQLSDLLFTTERSALENLTREAIAPERVHFVGNVMIDSLHANLSRAIPAAQTLGDAWPRLESGYAVATLHRPANVDDPAVLRPLLEVLSEISAALPIALPLHPRTRARIEAAGMADMLSGPGLALLPPLGYLQMLGLMKDSRLVLTDSGGIQEESTALGLPCFTLRPNTERPITIAEGTNTLVGTDPQAIRAAFADLRATGGKAGRIPELWDGKAAERIVAVLEQVYG